MPSSHDCSPGCRQPQKNLREACGSNSIPLIGLAAAVHRTGLLVRSTPVPSDRGLLITEMKMPARTALLFLCFIAGIVIAPKTVVAEWYLAGTAGVNFADRINTV